VSLTLYTPEPVAADGPAAEHYRRTLALHQRVSGGQDFTKQEQIHRALASGALEHVVHGANEPAVIHFHASRRALLAEADTDADTDADTEATDADAP
jgi:hypothetical protein